MQQHLRTQFSLFTHDPQVVYLDNAATTQTPITVLDAMQSYYTNYRANIHRGFYDMAIRADQAYIASKEAVATLIGASADEIIYTSGATAGLNMLARMLESEITSEHNIVLTEMEHHANLIPWQQLAKRTGCELRYIPVTDEYTLDYVAAKKMIDSNTKVVTYVHASNSLGTINDVTQLCTLAASVKAYNIVDACQTLAHLSINVRDMNCDFLVASGHKMYGPTGIGIVYGKQAHLDRLDPVVFGGDMIESVTFDTATWAESPYKFEAGTPPIAEAIGLGAACHFIIEHRAAIESEREITQYLVQALQTQGATIIGPASGGRVGAVSFSIGDVHPHDVADILAKQGICVRAGHHCTMPLMKKLGLPGTVRASIACYTTRADVDALIAGLMVVKKIFSV
jgi:cysteine desulfurase/selenocysteine lyase